MRSPLSRPRVLLADDHTVVLEAFAALLAPRCDVVGMVTDGHALVERAQALNPDVILVDVAMPRLNGLDACERVRQVVPGAKLVFLTMSQDLDTAREAIRRGASGYVLKSSGAAELFEAIAAALRGSVYVSPALVDEPVGAFVSSATASRKEGLSLRQREVLQLLAEGKSMREAAEILRVTPRTIAFHKYSMMEYLGLKTGAELIRYAINAGLVPGRGDQS